MKEAENRVAKPTRRVLRLLEQAMAVYDQQVGELPAHGNRKLTFRSMIATLIAAMFDPAVRSLRTIDDLSIHPSVSKISGVDRVTRSSLSDAMGQLSADALLPMIKALRDRQPARGRMEPELEQITRRLVAADGSYFNLAGEVVHAMRFRRGNGPVCQWRMRLNLQLDVSLFLPDHVDVSGGDDVSEPGALARSLQGSCVYLLDRGFVQFGLINAILAIHSSFVLRLKAVTGFTVEQSNALSEKDKAHHVLCDEVGYLPGPQSKGNQNARGCSAKPTNQKLRRIKVWDQQNKTEVVLLTDILDVPAYVIALLYRLRWQIELYLRWMKVLAGFDHLISQSKNGITIQFYVGVIMALLIHIESGHQRLSKYSLMWVSWIAQDRADPELMAQALARHEREKEKARLRREKKKQAK